jgi:hypothetical protein
MKVNNIHNKNKKNLLYASGAAVFQTFMVCVLQKFFRCGIATATYKKNEKKVNKKMLKNIIPFLGSVVHHCTTCFGKSDASFATGLQ